MNRKENNTSLLLLLLLLKPLSILKLFLDLLVLSSLGSTTQTTSSASSNQTNLFTSWSVSAHRGWVTNMLMVTTTVGMLYWVHCHTSNTWPAVSLGSVFVFCTSSLQKWLVNTSTTSNETDHCAAC
eukprot:m.239619 g.239619  ORF g.239619 m.239619 type:complete len:126 (-) comp13951_c0_seq1:527-904(-)